jgi:hypothetical protein
MKLSERRWEPRLAVGSTYTIDWKYRGRILDVIWSPDRQRSCSRGTQYLEKQHLGWSLFLCTEGLPNAGVGSGLPLNDFEVHQKMPLLNLCVALIVVGIALWLVNRFIPMASNIKAILNVVVVVAVGVFVLKAAGFWADVTGFRIGH